MNIIATGNLKRSMLDFESKYGDRIEYRRVVKNEYMLDDGSVWRFMHIHNADNFRGYHIDSYIIDYKYLGETSAELVDEVKEILDIELSISEYRIANNFTEDV